MMGATSGKVLKSTSTVAPFYDAEKDEQRSLLLISAFLFDEASDLQRLPKDLVTSIVLWEQHERRILSRSHYRICKKMMARDYVNKPRLYPCPSSFKPSDFSVDLVTASVALIDFLVRVKRITQFENVEFTTKQIEEYLKFLIVQQETKKNLLPSIEVQAVWLSHMLQSCPYMVFIDDNFPRVRTCNHPITWTHDMSPEELKSLEAETEELIAKKSSPSRFSASKKYWKSLTEDLTPQVVIYDRDWIVEFKKFVWGTDYYSKPFLEKAHFGYQKFIHLKSIRNNQVEQIGFSPCPSIDLMWHTHLIHPSSYEKDMNRLLLHVPKHKLLELGDRTQVFMDTRDDKSLNLWNSVFHESIFEYAS